MTWLRIAFDDAMTHAVHESLALALVADMRARLHPITNHEQKYGIEYARKLGGNPAPIDSWGFDPGGMRYVNTPHETITVDGLAVAIDCDAFPFVLSAIERAKVRRFAHGDQYYKLKFWIHATVLSPEQREAVLVAMRERADLADRRAREFSASIKAGREMFSWATGQLKECQ